jgi:hypothetical protein
MNPGLTYLGICYFFTQEYLEEKSFGVLVYFGAAGGRILLPALAAGVQREVYHVMSALWQRVGCQQGFLLKLWI